MKTNDYKIYIVFLLFLMLNPSTCYAFQEHGPKEGFYIHLLAHVCFGSSMFWLFFMIKKSNFWVKKCWKTIAIGALILAFWNVTTFTGHILSRFGDYYCDTIKYVHQNILFWVWYFIRFDTLISFLSMLCFYIGLKRLDGCIKTTETRR